MDNNRTGEIFIKNQSVKEREFSLTNRNGLELFFLGTGSAFTKRQYQTNLLIIKNSDHLLIDCGSKCPQAFYELGASITDIDNYLITHSHADHIGGLEEVCLMNRYFAKKKANMVIGDHYKKILWEMSLRGGVGFNESGNAGVLNFDDYFNVIKPEPLPEMPRETYSAKVGSIDLKIMRTKHIPDFSHDWQNSFWSCGVIIDDSVFFTSDTRYDEELITGYDKIFDFKAIFHDCQFFTGGVHASLEELNELPPGIKNKTFLTHYSDDWEAQEENVHKYGFKGLAKPFTYYSFP